MLLREMMVAALLVMLAAPTLTGVASGQSRRLAPAAGPHHIRSRKARFDQHAVFTSAAISSATAGLTGSVEIPGVGSSGSADFSLAGVRSIWVGEFHFVYDPSIVSASAVTKGAMPHACSFASNVEIQGQISVVLSCPQTFRPGPVLFSIVFAGVSAGSSTVHVESCKLNDGAPSCTTSDGQITVTVPSSGNPSSCADHCGESAGECACDTLCVQHGNCCADFHNVCGDTVTPLPQLVNTCQDHCGGNGGSCWCDTTCSTMGDCCADFKDACANGLPPAASSMLRLPTDAQVAAVGDSTSVDLSLNKSARIFGAQLAIRYDPSIVVATAVTKTGLPDDCLYVSNTNLIGQVRISFACLQDIAADGSLFSITFTAQSEGTTPLNLGDLICVGPCGGSDGSLTAGTTIAP